MVKVVSSVYSSVGMNSGEVCMVLRLSCERLGFFLVIDSMVVVVSSFSLLSVEIRNVLIVLLCVVLWVCYSLMSRKLVMLVIF